MLRRNLQRVLELAGGAAGALLISALVIVAAVGPGAAASPSLFVLAPAYV